MGKDTPACGDTHEAEPRATELLPHGAEPCAVRDTRTRRSREEWDHFVSLFFFLR